MVIRVLPAVEMTAPRRAFEKSTSFAMLSRLACAGFACGNEANAFATLGPCHEDQDAVCIHAQRVEALFVAMGILDRDRVRVLERWYAVGKTNPVFAEVGPGLGGVEGHHICTVCICPSRG